MKIEPGWLSIARSYLGIKEIVGNKNNPTITKMFARVGHPEVKNDETAWCAAFVGSCLIEAGLNAPNSLWALDYADYGHKLTTPLLGCIGVKRRYNPHGKVIGGHVFFIAAASKTWVWALGGNQNNSVSISAVPRESVIALRWPSGVQIPSKPLPLPTSLAGAVRQANEA
jgi:uncharacterized protein (TIGR02594 family)